MGDSRKYIFGELSLGSENVDSLNNFGGILILQNSWLTVEIRGSCFSFLMLWCIIERHFSKIFLYEIDLFYYPFNRKEMSPTFWFLNNLLRFFIYKRAPILHGAGWINLCIFLWISSRVRIIVWEKTWLPAVKWQRRQRCIMSLGLTE